MVTVCRLTFDMSGSLKRAKRALGCPLDGRVRCLPQQALFLWDLCHQSAELSQGDGILTVPRPRLVRNQRPHPMTSAVVHLGEATVGVQFEDKENFRKRRDGNAIALRGFDLHIPAFAQPVVTFEGSSVQLDPIVMGSQCLTETADHVSIRRELPPGEHGLELGHGGIDGPYKLREPLLVHVIDI